MWYNGNTSIIFFQPLQQIFVYFLHKHFLNGPGNRHTKGTYFQNRFADG
ncbi:hypothetical protein SAMN05660909_03988 [Chitinophaga terrae (ex Kim and Jung 2007)]|uniref:Uncharacterized protein n=1 Tax=Chitinophaga terrae (ex Kim and Jung 2007) TaxID=408074 RepID=A0A1H4EWM6_9BACT|nr:hypothetical protein [Chitinophaga terrae (ex Kim and Jung 2007)]SEA89453.1 hypothetical protein SAMN05660909_03988 [Chitinophaga terrae (ex Kim and Jung 2007)]